MTELRVLQYRTNYINGTPVFNERSSRGRLSLVDVAVVKENNETLKFIVGDKYSIWPGSYNKGFRQAVFHSRLKHGAILLCRLYSI